MQKEKNTIAAERRRRIYELAVKQGYVSVSSLAQELMVVENTIRRDLDVLSKEGNLIRAYGGATARERSLPSPPYEETRGKNMLHKSQIGRAALAFLPESGSVFINAGSTTFEMALGIGNNPLLSFTTNSPELAVHLASNSSASVSILGGKIVPDSLESDASMMKDILKDIYWDTAFLGISAIDIEHGITSINYDIAMLERTIIQNSRKLILLCDSSKLGRFAHARVVPINISGTLITDQDADTEILNMFRSEGIEIIIADSALDE